MADGNALAAHGVNCCLSTNNILNPLTPFGDGSLMRIANMYANVAQRGTRDELTECFAMMTERPAKFLGHEDYGVAVGNAADLFCNPVSANVICEDGMRDGIMG
ncbi:MAG: amidohydrolase family protein [Alphaproteobacteria bacterium]